MRGACAIEKPYRAERASRLLPAPSPALQGSSATTMKFDLRLSPLRIDFPAADRTAAAVPDYSNHASKSERAFPLVGPAIFDVLPGIKSTPGFCYKADLGRVFADHNPSGTLQPPIGQMRGLNPCL